MKFTLIYMIEFAVSMQNNTPEEIYNFLKTIKNPIQFIDSRIDADALCSAFAFYHILKDHFNIDVKVCYEKSISQRYKDQLGSFMELPPLHENIDPNTYDFSQHDCLICTDTGSLQHVSKMTDFERPQNIKILNIDHHEGNPGYGDYNYVKVLGAACSVIYQLIKSWQIKPSVQIANALLMGITLDTGFYNYNTTTSLDFHYSGELIELGAEHYKITWTLTFNENEADQKVRKLTFNNLVIDKQNKLAYTTITLKDLDEEKLNLEDSFLTPSDLIKKIQEIDFAFTVKELENENNVYSISIRSHSESFNSITLAKELNSNSGGHIMAAGANIQANSPEEAVQVVIAAAAKIRSQENS